MVVYGKQIFNYIIDNHSNLIKEIILSKKLDSKSFHKIRLLQKPIINLDEKKAQALAKGGNHQGYFLKIDEPSLGDINELKNKKSILILVGITDMGNIGSIIRSAYSLGIDGIVLSGIENLKMPQIIRSSSGAAIDSYILSYKNIDDLLNRVKTLGFKTYCASLEGKDIKQLKIDKDEKIAFLLGSEGDGLPKRIIKKCDTSWVIPMSGKFNSLNVSNAASIIAYKVTNE